MNKIERAIADCKWLIKSLESDRMIIMAKLEAYKEQLDNLESIESNKNIPHQEVKPLSNEL